MLVFRQIQRRAPPLVMDRSEEHTSELQSHHDLVCRLLLEKKKKKKKTITKQKKKKKIHRNEKQHKLNSSHLNKPDTTIFYIEYVNLNSSLLYTASPR